MFIHCHRLNACRHYVNKHSASVPKMALSQTHLNSGQSVSETNGSTIKYAWDSLIPSSLIAHSKTLFSPLHEPHSVCVRASECAAYIKVQK